MIINTNENHYTNPLNELFKSKRYTYAYISIGSKYNQPDVWFKPKGELSTRVDTNAIVQMVPMFLRTKPDNMHILNILIDIFPTQHDMDMNKRLIDTVITDNMDCIIINMKCTATNLKEILESIMRNILNQKINPLCFMICNYVKYMNEPNRDENESVIFIPKSIISVLNKTDYQNCYYEWYGYNYNLYNCIYNVLFVSRDLHFYQTTLKLVNYIKLISKPSITTARCSRLDGLLYNSYDISEYYDINCNQIAYPIKYTLQL